MLFRSKFQRQHEAQPRAAGAAAQSKNIRAGSAPERLPPRFKSAVESLNGARHGCETFVVRSRRTCGREPNLSSERRAPALRSAGASLSRGAGAPRSCGRTVVGPMAHLDTAPEKRWETERGCVRSTSRSDWRERHIEVVSPRLRIRGCCGWSFGHSRAPGKCRDALSDF